MAAPATALDPAPPEDSAPASSVGQDLERVAEDPPAPAFEPSEGITRVRDDSVTDPTFAPVDTSPPKLDSAQFGVGWPAAAAVAVALLAVLAMALLWRRDDFV